MSAVPDGEPKEVEGGKRCFSFTQWLSLLFIINHYSIVFQFFVCTCMYNVYLMLCYIKCLRSNVAAFIIYHFMNRSYYTDGGGMTKWMVRFKHVRKVPIPSYLLAIACGNLASRRLGPRSHVWSEPEAVEACAFAPWTRPDICRSNVNPFRN